MKKIKASVYTALMNYPSLNKMKDLVVTSITPLSVHDIARASATYGVKRYFLINPVPSQKRLINRIVEYWEKGFGSSFNHNRKIALKLIKPVNDLVAAMRFIERAEKKRPILVTTSAKVFPNTISYADLREKLFSQDDVFLILFGTGWGIPDEIMLESDLILEAVNGYSDFNHLSVRSAASIILDRLMYKED
ncbi:RNA methyltransferase [bacterium]|nr:RNA methyltransferase [bacterium]MCK5599765.1 RNA methyltransferase [bacterium]